MSARSAMPAWVTDPRALSLLAGSGRPFDQDGYRRAYRDTYPEADDCSFGAVMPDGTQAAMALMGRAGSVNDGLVAGRVAESVPFGFGGVVSTRLLSDLETAAFLDAARQASTSRVLLARSLPIIEGRVIESPGTHIGWASVVRFVGGQTPAGLFASRARQSIRRATRAGAQVSSGRDPEAFLSLYRSTAGKRRFTYPDALIRALATRGVVRFYDVWIEGKPVESAAALPARDQWVYWLGAQNEAGRLVEAGYLAVATMLHDAHRAGARVVDMGSNGGFAGVARFKRRFGAEDVPILELRSITMAARAEITVLRWVRRARSDGRQMLRPRRERT